MGRFHLLLAVALALGVVGWAPAAEAHTCVGADCGGCDGPGDHDHAHEEAGSRTACTSQDEWPVPAAGAGASLATAALAAAGVAALSSFRRPS